MNKIKPISFYFLRHCQTDWNNLQLCQGQKNIPLNLSGRNEAHEIGKLIDKIHIKSICYSPLARAEETAAIIASYLPESRLYPISALQERAWGRFEGLSNEYMYQQEEAELSGSVKEKENGVEFYQDFLIRVLEGINMSISHPAPVLIVSHGRVFHALCQLMHVPIIKQIPHIQLIQCIPVLSGWELKTINL